MRLHLHPHPTPPPPPPPCTSSPAGGGREGMAWRREGCAAGLQDSLQRTSHDLRRRRRRSASSPSRPGSGCPGSSAVTSTKSSSSRRSVPSTTATLATMAAPAAAEPRFAWTLGWAIAWGQAWSYLLTVCSRAAPRHPRADMSRARRSMDHADMRARRSPEITLDLADDELPIRRRLPNHDIN